ncbi:hypothetical protein FRC16_000863 [Serendipita sp. 398]|nr:hypothetical protein FRC16_000863 [Serendipita sp. 398]
MIEFSLQEESQQLTDPSTYNFDDEIDFSNMDGNEVTSMIEDAIVSLASASDSVTTPGNPSIFSVFRSALKHAESLPPNTIPKILDSIISSMASELEATVRDLNPSGANASYDSADVDQATMNTHKAALELYAFLLLWVVGVGEKVSGVEDDGAAAATKGKRTTTKGSKAGPSSKTVKKKTTAWQWVDQIPNTLVIMIHSQPHLIGSEISQKTFSAVDTKGPRTYGRFLMHLGELCPKIVLKQMSLLLDHVDSEAYPMRIAMVEIIGNLIKYLAGADQIEKREKKINSLFDMLTERYLDVSSFVRVKVMQVLSRVWE